MSGSQPGLMFVLSGPSGAGKSTVLSRVLGALGDIHFSVSATTREPRKGEQEGFDYCFVSHDDFRQMIARDELLEYAEVHGQFYGTPAGFVREKLEAGQDVVLDLDVQGARQVRKRCNDAIYVFMAPPSMEELSRRLHGRHTENEERVQMRLERAKVELTAIREYDYLVVNDQIAVAALRLQSIIEAERARVDRVIWRWPQLEQASDCAPVSPVSPPCDPAADPVPR